jgi:hypothetical protein
MCHPLVAVVAAQSVLQIGAARQQQRTQEAYYMQNRQNAIAARDLKVQQLNLRNQQEKENIAGQKLNADIEAMKNKSRRIVSAGEAGFSGGLLEALVMETEATNLRNQTDLNTQARGLDNQFAFDVKGLEAETTNRINSVKRGEPVNELGIIASNAVSAYGSYELAKL